MTSFLDQVNWHNTPSVVNVSVPKEITGIDEELIGQLRISDKGFVYTERSKAAVWIRFFGLAFYLPLKGLAAKCDAIFKRIITHEAVPQKGYHDLDHVGKLASIAWKGMVGWGKNSLHERLEEFALAELDYNNRDRQDEIEKPRSKKFSEGMYVARCMQPLFEVSQYTSPLKLTYKIEEMEQKISLLQEARANLKLKDQPKKEPGFFDKYFTSAKEPKDYPFSHLNNQQISQEIQACYESIEKMEKQQKLAKRCEKYALHSILSQQYCLGAKAKFRDTFVETQADVECCGITCYRQQKICGIIYKVDCCATTCWAIDCFCCKCCLWPDAGWCVIG